jgi:hypothetical protein
MQFPEACDRDSSSEYTNVLLSIKVQVITDITYRQPFISYPYPTLTMKKPFRRQQALVRVC